MREYGAGFLLLVMASCFGVKGSGDLITEKRDVGSFDAVEISGALTLEARIGTPAAVELHGDDNLLPLIETKLEGTKLVVKAKENVRPKDTIVLRVVTPALNRLELSGATEAKVTGLAAEKFVVDASGASDIELSGTAKHLDASISGAGSLSAEDLKTETTKIDISGAGNAEVYASKSLDANVSGAGNIEYAGNPAQVNKDVSGAGSISAK